MTRDKEHNRKLGKEQQLLEAARLGQFKQLESILVELQAKSKKRSNPLASLRKSVGPNSARDPVTGFTCLHHSALNGHTECVQLMLDHGAKINAVDYKGSSALHLASWAGNLQVVKILVNHTTSLLNGPTSGRHGQQQSQEALPSEGQHFQEVDVNLRNNDNQTPLSLAAQFGHNQVVSELLAHSASVHLRNNQLESPLDLACLNGRLETARLLLASSPELLADLRRPQSTLRLPASDNEYNMARPTCGLQPADGINNGSHARRPSGSGWSSLLRSKSRDQSGGHSSPTSKSSPTGETTTARGRRATLAGIKADEQYLDNRAQGSLFGGERLLDHSPLHCAVRRGHLHVVRLLLSSLFRANVMQVTSVGSVLHELAAQSGQSVSLMSNRCASELGELIGLLMSQLIEQQRQLQPLDKVKRRQMVEAFLNLTNSNRKNVFEVLSELNNRSAQEMRRLINEISTLVVEQEPQPQQAQHYSHQQAMQLTTTQPPNGTFEDSQLVQTSQRQQQPQQLQPFFSDNQQINSFVTMKRLPKQTSSNKLLNPATSSNHLQQQQQQQLSGRQPDQPVGAFCTQTIDRRNRAGFARPAPIQAATPAGWQAQSLPGPQVGGAITRSVSNLIQGDLSLEQLKAMSNNPNDDRQASLLWRQWLAQGLSNADQLATFQDKLDWRRQQTHLLANQPNKRSQSRDLSSLLLEAHQNQASYNDHDQLYDNETYESRLAQTNGSQMMQQQQQHPLVRSQTDCSHLMGRLFGDQLNGPANVFKQQTDNRSQEQGANKQQHVDRKAINRHYHVYEHEFYPPRLMNGPQVAAVAVVPPLNRSESTGGGASSAGPLRSPNSFRAMQRALQAGESRESEQVDGRLSLNLENISRQSDEETQQASQQQHKDRFLGRHSRKVVSSNQAIESKQQQLLDLQRHLMVQQQQLRESHSLESHLGEAHLFESTRRALMHDFDQMIGRELLNQDYRHQLDTSLAGRQGNRLSSSIGSQNSILTGVSLDMDTRGECLTVSGTRITMSPAEEAGPEQQLAGCVSVRQPAGSEANLVQVSRGDQQTSRLEGCSVPSGAPRRPPRPLQSLLSDGNRKQQDHRPSPSASISSSIIYDLPVGEQRPTSNSSGGFQVSAATLATPELAGRRLLGSQRAGGQSTGITEPPHERPPPRPAPPAPSTFLAVSVGASSSVGPRSSPEVVAAASPMMMHQNSDQPTGGLLKMGSISSTGSSGSSQTSSTSSSTSATTKATFVVSSNGRLHHDTDSGICTSNSPSSMSHDSERPPRGEHHRPPVEVGAPPTLSAVQQQPARGEPQPPSPETAQLCIEEALQPLEQNNTRQVANQTSPQAFSKSKSTGHVNEVVVGWLGDTYNIEDKEPQAACYENCLGLQRELESKSIDDLFDDLMRSSSRGAANDLQVSPIGIESTAASSSSSLASKHRQQQPVDQIEDEDYAGESTTSERENSSSSSMKGFSFTPANQDEYLEQTGSKKEIMLKVVVEEKKEQSIDGNEVFYIKPSELKRISKAANGADMSQTAEAETLTDEELYASVDKHSGFIKFTLRKRTRNETLDENNDGHQSAINICDNSEQLREITCNASQSLDEAETMRANQTDHLLAKQVSSDSNELDSSQASSSTATSSSTGTTSSSIKSIVSLKRLTETRPHEATTEAPDEPERGESHDKQVDSQQDQKGQVSSIVSETARKLEAASKVQQIKPVAAARKSQVGQVRPQVAPKRPEPSGEVIATSSGRVNDLRQQLELSTIRRQPQPLRKTICWPPSSVDQSEVSPTDSKPQKQQQQQHQPKDEHKSPIELLPVLGRVSTNRLSFQRLIEEKTRENQSQKQPAGQIQAQRPKPAPPAKPAILVAASRINNI